MKKNYTKCDESSEDRIKTTSNGQKTIQATCNHCGCQTKLVFEKIPLESGGTSCHSCGKYDNFDAKYYNQFTKEINVFITYFSKEGIRSKFLLKDCDPEKIKPILKENELDAWEVCNVLVDAKLYIDESKKKVNSLAFVGSAEEQDKKESKIARKIIKAMNGE